MKVTGFACTDVGRKREQNEDFVLTDPSIGLYLVCDGMGGHAAGDVAAQTAAKAVHKFLLERRSAFETFNDSSAQREGLGRLAAAAVSHAAAEVYELATSSAGKAGMGTTLTLLLTVKNVAVMAHVGDSRLYMRRAGRTHQLSEDHSYVSELVRRGGMTLEEAQRGPYGNVITRAVGIQRSVHADTLAFDLLAGDTFLLCSDGLCKYARTADELGELLDNDHLASIPTQLVEIANSRGGTDNISAVVVRAESEAADDLTEQTRTTDITGKLRTLREVALFRLLDMGELCKVLNVADAREVQEGEVVIREGEKGDALYAIVEGKLRVTRGGKDVVELGAGTHVGDMALVNSRPRSATVRALCLSRLLVIERSKFNDLVRKEPVLGVKLLWSLAQVLSYRLDETSDLLVGARGEHGDHNDLDTLAPF